MGENKTPKPAVLRATSKDSREMETTAPTQKLPTALNPEQGTQPAPPMGAALETEKFAPPCEFTKKRALKSVFTKLLPDSDGPPKK